MTKEKLREGFQKGFDLMTLLPLVPNQEYLIYKADQFRNDDEIIYIPDIRLNYIDAEIPPIDKDIQHIINLCYTGAEFVNLCEGDEDLAYRVFCCCNWQHPLTAFLEIYDEDKQDKD